MKQLIGPFSQLLTMDRMPLKGPIRDSQLAVITNGALLMDGKLILEVGTFDTLLKKHQNTEDVKIIELPDDHVCLPGLIDAHTHICFAGSRASDYALRNAGSSYLEIAEKGGGIWDTVTKTREASQQDLIFEVISRTNRHLQDGITTVEVKSGYGFSVEEELKMLRAIHEANHACESDLISTCLAAHVKPKDFAGTASEYLQLVYEKLFPIIKNEKLSNRVDAFIEQGAFTQKEVMIYLQKAKEYGFDITIHADQFSVGGSEVAVDFNAVSADHLEVTTEREIKALAQSDVVATALPGASIGLGCSFTPARKILDAGGCLAIASDWNPGSAPMGDLLMQASVLATYEKLTNAEVLAAITYRAAHALRLQDRAILSVGKLADFVLFPTTHYNEILYNQGKLKPSQVWKNGQLVSDKHSE